MMSIAPLRMPIGESDFRLLIQDKYYFVDKSLFIKEVLNDPARVILITRPRRFGKTLNLSMLRYYFAKEVDGQPTAGLFNGLAIQEAEEAIRQHQGQYPVIFFTLKDLQADTFERFYRYFLQLMARIYREHRYLLTGETLAPDEQRDYQATLERQASVEVISDALRSLSEYLHRYHQVAPLILIDEYDTPIQLGHMKGYYPEIIGFFRSFLGAALKDNPHCFKAVLTGILRVSKESLFSGLNNIRVYSVLQQHYGEYFGFTEDEVRTLLTKTDLADKSEAIRSWYNGYQIGPHTLYNPWSLLNCIQERGELIPYWVNTSGNDLVKECLYQSGLIHQEVFEQLLQSQSVNCLINEQIAFPDLTISAKGEATILSFLLMTGYLKPVAINRTMQGTQCRLVIPNLEVLGLYANLIESWLVAKQSVSLNEFLSELLRGDLSAFEKSFGFFLENTISVHDLSHEPEAFYHGFMAGLTAHLQWHPDYLLKSNRESGYGRYGYLILSCLPDKPTILMEFKRIRLSSDHPPLNEVELALAQAAQEALAQIEEKAYYAEAKQSGSHHVIKLAIAFCGKRFKMLSA